MSKARRHDWEATARALVLYNHEGQWRFAIYNDTGIIDGALPDPPVAVEDAQARLVALVQEMTEQRYVAVWKSDKPHWWTADLHVQA